MDVPAQTNNKAAEAKDSVSSEVVARKLKFDYSYGSKDLTDRTLESLQTFFRRIKDPAASLQKLLQDIADLIYRQFRIREVSIGLRDPSDGLFKYQVVHTVREGVKVAHLDLAYRYEDFFDESRWRGTSISNYSKLMLAEDMPYQDGEMATFDEELMRKSNRKSEDESIEGDYIDILIKGTDDDLLGWIEISGTWDMKIPTARTIRSLELIASALGLVLSNQKAVGQRLSTPQKAGQPRIAREPRTGVTQKR